MQIYSCTGCVTVAVVTCVILYVDFQSDFSSFSVAIAICSS